jgi:anti-sigma regulatory factor (Ser/Thr protein kinase)
MSPRPDPVGYLMRDSWRTDAVLAHKVELAGGNDAPAAARAVLERLLAGRLGALDLFDTLVLVSELVTNAVRHGRCGSDETVILHVALAPGVLRVEVCDQGPGFTPPAVVGARPEGGGNGLVLLDRMSTAWGVAGDDGTCVWFERELA